MKTWDGPPLTPPWDEFTGLGPPEWTRRQSESSDLRRVFSAVVNEKEGDNRRRRGKRKLAGETADAPQRVEDTLGKPWNELPLNK